MYFEYYLFNRIGTRSSTFIVANVILSSIRNTFARVIALLVSLGYGITFSQIDKYIP